MSADRASKADRGIEETQSTREVVVADMDRTLMACDLTVESILALISRFPRRTPAMLGWLLSGRSTMKQKLAEQAMPDIDFAPPNPEVVDYLKAKKAEGALIVLASASNEKMVQAVADRFGIFDEVYGSVPGNNFKGSAKADGLDEKYGKGGYTYIGDSPADLKVWSRAGKAVTAGVSETLQKKAEAVASQAEHLSLASRATGAFFKGLIQTIQPHRWLKNILIFVPLLVAQAASAATVMSALIGFVAFSLTASGVYVLSDMLNIDGDRAHPRARSRPFASGIVPIKDGLMLAPVLLVAGFSIAAFYLPLLFLAVLGGYFLVALGYAVWLKRIVPLGIFLLAGLYTSRVLAGGVATGVSMSPWLIGFSMTFFLALAIVKRKLRR